jgi:hypothetical protein
MTRFGDDADEMSVVELGDREVEALLAGREVPGEEPLAAALGLVRSVIDDPAPSPSAALAVVLRDGLALPGPAAPPGRARAGTRAAGVAATIVAALGITVGAAAADMLPAPVQVRVADVVGRLTPLELPRPADRSAPADDAPVGPGAPEPVGDEREPANLRPPSSGERQDGEAHDRDAESARNGGDRTRDTDDAEHETDDDQLDHAEEPDERETDEPEADEPEADESEADEPEADEPEADESEADESEADESETDEPEVDEPEREVPTQVLDDAGHDEADTAED